MADEELETWQANSRIVLRKYDLAGNLQEVLVNRGRRIQLTARERVLNQDRVAEETRDPFANGTLSPVRLPDSSKESAQAIVDSPNTMSDEDLVSLVGGHHKTFEKRLGEVTSPYVVRRMLAIAKEGEVDVTVKRLEQIEARLQELNPDRVEVYERDQI